jgi:hypothetical protein
MTRLDQLLADRAAGRCSFADLDELVGLLAEERKWLHCGLTTAFSRIHPGFPIPDWSVMYAAWRDAEDGNVETIDEILAKIIP